MFIEICNITIQFYAYYFFGLVYIRQDRVANPLALNSQWSLNLQSKMDY